jgi:REP element-mobilizing transposase RayT
VTGADGHWRRRLRIATLRRVTFRIEEPGTTYHINANALDGMPLFRDDADRELFFHLLADEVAESEWTLLEYTLMTTHYHLLLRIQKRTLSSGFKRLQSRYARRYNKRHGRRGVVWMQRFHDEPIESERHLYETVRYIALNAPRARMVEAAEHWAWCSYGSAIGLYPPDPIVDEKALLTLFARDPAVARRRLRAFVEEKDPRVRWRQTRVRRLSDAEK